jgi:hypothetical protein
MEMIMMLAVTMRMHMSVRFAGIVSVGMEMDALSPQRVSHRQSKRNEHHSHPSLERFRPGGGNCKFEQHDGCSDHQQNDRMPQSPAKPNERGTPQVLILRRDGQDRRDVVSIQRMSDA